MLRIFFTLLLSWSVSSWLLTETFFFFPGVQPAFDFVEEMITIPRHDEWDTERVQKESHWLAKNLDKSSFGRKMKDVFGVSESSSVRSRVPLSSTSAVVYEIGQLPLDALRDSIPYEWWYPQQLKIS